MSNPLRVTEVFRRWSVTSPERPALVEPGGVWTYGCLAKIVSSTKSWLLEEGIRAGDRVILVGDNSRALVALLFGVMELDAWPVPVSSNISTAELERLRVHCGARRIFRICDCARAAAHAKRLHESIKKFSELGTISISPLNTGTKSEKLDSEPAERIGVVLYTSGSTGIPKGVMISNRALLFVASGSAKLRSLTPADRLYGVLPFSHVVGLTVILFGGLLSGATIYLARQFNPIDFLQHIERGDLTVVLGAPGMFSLLVQYARSKGLRSLRSSVLRIISSAGAPLHSDLKPVVEGLFGLVLHNGYGLTELSPTIAQTRIDCPCEDTSVGPPFPGVEVKIVGPEGKDVSDGEMGELLVRGPNLMSGYYRAPEETKAAIDADGWFNTHDVARMKQGNLYIVGRTSDLIIHYGHNVYPAEIEAAIRTHAAVARAAVIGRKVSESEGGEELIAVVQPASGVSVTERELIEHAALRLATYKRPSKFILVNAMPTTPTGKIIRQELRKLVDGTCDVQPVEGREPVNA